jgi:hypothetical protein
MRKALYVGLPRWLLQFPDQRVWLGEPVWNFAAWFLVPAFSLDARSQPCRVNLFVISLLCGDPLQVRQQLDSFDQFITNELQEIVSGTPTMSISAQKSYAPGVKTHEVR